METTISLNLHPGQMRVFNDPRRFKIVVAGRRWGKSHLAIAYAVSEAMRVEMNGYDLTDKGVFLIAPTHDQAKRIFWAQLKRLTARVATRVLENTGRIEFINGRWLEVRGADKPDSLRGVGLSAVVLDEFASMKPNVWEEIIRPALTDVQGNALFIGTPAGKNHFYGLTMEAKSHPQEWGVWHFKSVDNPFLDKAEVQRASRNMTAEQFAQEYEASFAGSGAGLLKLEWIKQTERPSVPGFYTMAVDLAGFVDAAEAGKNRRLNETAIVVVYVHENGWHVEDIRHGLWGVRECAVQILKAAKDYEITQFGIEKGTLLNAVAPYLMERMKKLNYIAEVVPLVHGGKRKTDRIMWALAGRLEKGSITFEIGAPWLTAFIEQYSDFPNPLANDDMLDALAYIDQMTGESGDLEPLLAEERRWRPLDSVAGY